MAQLTVHPWVAVNANMTDEYRETVVEVAWERLSKADKPLQRFVARSLSAVAIPGFRSLSRVPGSIAKRHITEEMMKNNAAAAAIICLWADAKISGLMAKIVRIIEDYGWQIRSDWSWNEASKGFYAPEEVDLVETLFERIPDEYQDLEKDDLLLATLWLSRGFVRVSDEESVDKAISSLTPSSESTLSEESRQSEQQDPCLESSAQDVEETEIVQVIGQTFEALITDLHDSVNLSTGIQQSVIGQAQNFMSSLKAERLIAAQEQIQAISTEIERWESCRQKLQARTKQVASRVIQELAVRLDLDPDHALHEQMHKISESEQLLSESLDHVFGAAEQILSYDKNKDRILTELDHTQAQMTTLLSDLAVWARDTTSYEEQLIEQEALADSTLQAVQMHLVSAKKLLQELRNQLVQLLESSRNRIVAMAQSLQERSGTPVDYEPLPGFRLSEISVERLVEFGPEHLSHLEQVLEDAINQQTMSAQDRYSPAIAAKLIEYWEPDLFRDLLQALADENRDAETVLVLLASAASYPGSENLMLGDQVVDSFLRGLDLFSEEASPSQLLNLSVSTLLRGWKPKEAISKTKLCLHLIAAKYAGKYHLPSDFLWEVATEWPFNYMTEWSKLWEGALLESTLPLIIDEREDVGRNLLEQARQQCQQMFARESGAFVRLRSVKSRRHQAMMYDYLLPDLEELWHGVQHLETQLDHASETYEITRWTAQLETLIHNKIEEKLDEDTLAELYDHAAHQAQVQDPDPFHRRTVLRVLQEYYQSLYGYVQALLKYWATRAQQIVLSRDTLLQELASQPELPPIGQAVIAELVQRDQKEKPEWVATEAEQVLHRCFLSVLLGQAAYAWRLPRVVGYLVANQIVWADILSPLLEDLAQPAEVAQSARMLVEQRAPNQALLLAQQAPLELQKQIQNQRVKEERNFTALQEELLKTGGDTEDLAESRRLGRFPLLLRVMEERLNFCQTEVEQKALQMQQQARELLSEINRLEMEAFEIQSLMPAEMYDLIEQGLNLARSTVRQPALFPKVRDYLSEIRYRLEHESWSRTDLQQMVARLGEVVSGRTPQVAERDARAVLELLEQENLRALGLSSDDLSSSEISTRIDILQSWLEVQELPSFLSENLRRAQRDDIHRLFGAFAQMTAMARCRTPTSSPLTFEEPIVYEYWTLKYPKVSVLERDCILVVLPGTPPSPRYLKELDNIIQEKEWLTYAFVLLFAPGLAEPQAIRLKQSYQDRGLVIIDSRALLEMILAEAELHTPIGYLRAMMLNAFGAQSVDVFKVNQSVEPRMGIFVGRDHLVRKISSSGDNYALYGGRRIGKSSLLGVVGNLLRNRGWIVVSDSFEGRECSDESIARALASKLPLEVKVQNVEDFRGAIQQYLDTHLEAHIVLLLDEIDPYIRANPDRHIFIETLRALTEQYGNRFRVIVAGFMYLYNCLQGEGPYSPSSDPWRRMFNATCIDNLSAISAENIVKEGFLDVLGWDFENRAVARWIVERTSGHPAFIQYYCIKLKDLIAQRSDHCVRLQDILDVFEDDNPNSSFISHVRSTLTMNLDSIEGAIGRYVILWLAHEEKDTPGFTFAQAQEIASLSGVEIPEEHLRRALERLKVTSVVEERSPDAFDFSVPDYPLILNRLGDTAHLEELESELQAHFGGSL